MIEINFDRQLTLTHHECESTIEGDWFVFRCPICKDYERRINCLTGETAVKNISAVISHSGRHMPLVKEASPCLN